MVNRILKIFNREIIGIHQAAYLLGFFALMSQILALFRDRLLAHAFGAGHSLDIYYAAFRIPDFLFASVASLVSISVLIPFLTSKAEHHEDVEEFMNTLFTGFLGAMVLVSILFFFLIPYMIDFLLPGIKDPGTRMELQNLARLLLLQPICLGISNLLGSITQMHKRFFLYSLSPIIYNASIIFGIVVLYPLFGLYGLIYGVIIGAFFHFFIQVPYIRSKNMLPHLTLKPNWKKLKQVAYLSLPRTITLSANSLELVFITSYASFMAAGSISIFNLSLNLQSVPFAIIGVSYALAAFPTLSTLYSKGEKGKFMEHIITASRHIIFWSLPVMSLFIVLRAQIVRTILGSGHFSWSDTRLTSACLALFVISLVGQGLELLFIRGYYASGNTWKPLAINLISSFFTITLPYVFVVIFDHSMNFRFFIEALFKVEDIPGTSVLMLPLGYSIGTFVNTVIFWFYFEKDFKNFSKPLLKTLWESFAAAIIMGFVSYLFLGIFANIFNINTLPGIFLQGFCAGILGIIMGIFVLKLVKSPELDEIAKSLTSRIWKTKVTVPDQTEISA